MNAASSINQILVFQFNFRKLRVVKEVKKLKK